MEGRELEAAIMLRLSERFGAASNLRRTACELAADVLDRIAALDSFQCRCGTIVITVAATWMNCAMVALGTSFLIWAWS